MFFSPWKKCGSSVLLPFKSIAALQSHHHQMIRNRIIIPSSTLLPLTLTSSSRSSSSSLSSSSSSFLSSLSSSSQCHHHRHHQYVQVRYKNSKASSRYKLPPVPKEKAVKEFKRIKPKITEEVPPDEKSDKPAPDDVWNTRYFPTAKFSFLEAINRHREFASPEMIDNMEGVVILEAELDLTTKKKTKFLGAPEGIILLPHNFDNFLPGRVIAITKTDEDKSKAEAAGATYTGSLDLIRKLERGEIKGEDYDHVVLNNDMLVEAAILKKILKDQFPTKKNGNLGADVEGMVKLFADGKEYQGSKLSDAVGTFTFPIGKLSMTNEQLLENVKAVLQSVSLIKPAGGLFAKIILTCPPSKERFYVDDVTILPIPTVAKEGAGTKSGKLGMTSSSSASAAAAAEESDDAEGRKRSKDDDDDDEDGDEKRAVV